MDVLPAFLGRTPQHNVIGLRHGESSSVRSPQRVPGNQISVSSTYPPQDKLANQSYPLCAVSIFPATTRRGARIKSAQAMLWCVRSLLGRDTLCALRQFAEPLRLNREAASAPHVLEGMGV